MRSEQTSDGTLEHWTPQEVAEALERGEIAVIDVRTPQEYMLEHVPGAFLMPMSEFDPARLPEGGPKRLVFHCGSGARSEKVARRALEAGLTPVAHIEGGFAAWKKAGCRYLGTDPSTGAPKPMGGSG